MIKLRVREIKVRTVRCPLKTGNNGEKDNNFGAVRLKQCLSCPFFCGLISSGQYIECSGDDNRVVRRLLEDKNEL